jgi:hypothetical protein
MTPAELASRVAGLLNLPSSYVAVEAHAIHSPGSREYEVPARHYNNWTVTIKGQDLDERLQS